MNLSPGTLVLATPDASTVTLRVPWASAGETAVTSVPETTMELVAATKPTFTLVVPIRLVPVMFTVVPPAVGPEVGETEVTEGWPVNCRR